MLNFLEKNQIFQELSNYIKNGDMVFVALSGGPDSMLVFKIVEEYMIELKFDLNNLHIIHFNHKQREESNIEQKYIEEELGNYNVYVGLYKGNKSTEEFFRKERYGFFDDTIKSINKKKSDNDIFLILGHNLTDRIETSFLNILRGCDIKGFLNMNFFEKKSLGEYSIIRPIINLTKYYVQDICNSNGIKYFIDKTNFDKNVSKRNIIRSDLIKTFEKLSHQDKCGNLRFYSSFMNIYQSLNEKLNNGDNDNLLTEIQVSKYWNSKFAYKSAKKIDNLDIFIKILDKLGIYKNINRAKIVQLYNFVLQSRKGYKYIFGVNILKSHGEVYFIKGVEGFWKMTIEDKIKITKMGIYELGDFNINIDRKNYVGGTIRFIGSLRSDKGRKIKKKLISKKIPFFWRNFVLIIEKDGKLLDVLSK